MKSTLFSQIELLLVQSSAMQGVFSTADLQTIFNTKNEATFFNTLAKLQKIKMLTRFTKGIYVTKDYSAEMLNARIDPDAYISMGSVLAKNGLIGTMPDRVLTAVRVGRNRVYSDKNLQIKHFGISQQLYFGFSVVEGIKVADNEKAFVDLLYYRMKGARYTFDELSDVDLTQLNIAKCKRYLKNYRNKRFVAFCLETLRG